MTAERWFPLQTRRLVLREFLAADERDIHEYASDLEVVRYVPWGPNTPEDTRRVLNERLKEQKQWPRDDVTLAIELKGERKVIGSIRLGIRDPSNRTADFGYVLNRSYWHRGYTTEASQAIVRCAFLQLNLHRLFATCDTRNGTSMRVMERLGMRREAHFLADVLQRAQWRDSYLYALLETELRRGDESEPIGE